MHETRTTAVHASAVAIGGRALLISGASRAGKSRLAVALIGASSRKQRIQLIGDDRILLAQCGKDLVARPHPRIAGFVERRGLGLVAMPFVASAPLAGIALIGPAMPAELAHIVENFPVLRIVGSSVEEDHRAAVLAWWSDIVPAARKQHSARKAEWTFANAAKD